MGIFDVPAPLLGWLDGHASSFASPTIRLILWGLISAAFSMGLYWLLSPQEKIAETKAKALEARRALDSYDGEFSGAWPRIDEMLRLSLKQVGIVTLPAVLASLPILCVLVWMSTAYGHYYPQRDAHVEVRTFPQQIEARWMAGSKIPPQEPILPIELPHVEILGALDDVVAIIPVPAPVPTVHKRQWWNALFGNPAGYLPDDARIDRIEIDLPSQEFLPFGPGWMRSWEFLYLVVLLLASIAIKVGFRIK